ncbi:MAG: MAPEG family protein [Alcanivorax sp.]|nr:MAPEG family protein [Alcanivorax sp.]
MTHDHLVTLYLLAYAGWALLLLLTLLAARGLSVLAGKAKADDFPPYHYNPGCPLNRLSRAYLNTLELLGVLAVVVGVGLYLGYADLAAELLPWLLMARVAQTVVHLIGVNHWLVMVRFSFFLLQVAIVVCLATHILVQVL